MRKSRAQGEVAAAGQTVKQTSVSQVTVFVLRAPAVTWRPRRAQVEGMWFFLWLRREGKVYRVNPQGMAALAALGAASSGSG